jgi:hypothetical protein
LSWDDKPIGSGPSAQPDGGGVAQPPEEGSAPPKERQGDDDLSQVRKHVERERTRKELQENYPAQFLAVQFVANPVFVAIVTVLLGEGFLRMRLVFQILTVTFALGITLLLTSALLTKGARDNWLKVAAHEGGSSLWNLVGVTLAIWLWATVGFAALSAIFYLQGIVTTGPDRTLRDPVWDSAANFYIWKSLDSIPVLEIPETVGWEPAFRFTDHVSPMLLLVYKIVVILPLIETVRLIWQRRRTRAAA